MDQVVRLTSWEQKQNQAWKLISRPPDNPEREWVVKETATGRVERLRELKDMLDLVDSDPEPASVIPLNHSPTT